MLGSAQTRRRNEAAFGSAAATYIQLSDRARMAERGMFLLGGVLVGALAFLPYAHEVTLEAAALAGMGALVLALLAWHYTDQARALRASYTRPPV